MKLILWSAENFKSLELTPKEFKEHATPQGFPRAGRSTEQPGATKRLTPHGAQTQRFLAEIKH